MRRTRLVASLAALAVVIGLTACAPFKTAAPAGSRYMSYGSAHPLAQQLYELVNNERAANGLGPVGWNDQLGGTAQSWSEHMASTGDFSHQNLGAMLQSPEYSNWSALGENILKGGCAISAWEMHQAWMNSPSHRANILGNYNAIGIGIACNGSELYATEDFGR